MPLHIWEPFHIKEQIRILDMFSFFQFHYDPNYTFTGETHNFWECLYVMSGQICVSADERIYHLQSGEIIFHKPMELHKFTISSSEGADLLIFSFSAEGELTIWLKNKVFKLSDHQVAILNALLTYMDAQPAAGEAPFHSLQYLAPYQHIPGYLQTVITYLYQLFLSLASEASLSVSSTAPDAILFQKAITYLNNNLSGSPSVDEVAHYCNISVSSLKRIFDKYAGISVHQYLLKLKIKVAIDLLESGETVTSVSERTGFSNQNYFSKAFKRETGKSPSEFRHL